MLYRVHFELTTVRSVLDTTLCDKVSDLRQVGGFLHTPVSSTNKTDSHDITEILVKVALNWIFIVKLKFSGRPVAPLGHIIPIPIQPIFARIP
jgi:hypothetical protein